MAQLYFEDFHEDQVIELGSASVSEEEMIRFATSYDPQPFHIDPERAKSSFFGGLIASGWHTGVILMRLLVDGLINQTESLGSPGVDEVRWPRPVRPGDVLRARFTVLSCTPSKSRGNMGIVRSRSEVVNQQDEVVMTLIGTHFIGRRPT